MSLSLLTLKHSFIRKECLAENVSLFALTEQGLEPEEQAMLHVCLNMKDLDNRLSLHPTRLASAQKSYKSFVSFGRREA